MKKRIKLSTYAKLNDISYRGALARFKKGQIPGAAKDPMTGSIYVEVDDEE